MHPLKAVANIQPETITYTSLALDSGFLCVIMSSEENDLSAYTVLATRYTPWHLSL